MVSAADLSAYVGRTVDAGAASAAISVVKSMASAYTRGRGFTNGEPNADIRAVIISATARRVINPNGFRSEQHGPEGVQYGSADWTVAELMTLNRYRIKAQ